MTEVDRRIPKRDNGSDMPKRKRRTIGKQTSIRIDSGTLQEFRKLADRRSRSVSELMRKAIKLLLIADEAEAAGDALGILKADGEGWRAADRIILT